MRFSEIAPGVWATEDMTRVEHEVAGVILVFEAVFSVRGVFNNNYYFFGEEERYLPLIVDPQKGVVVPNLVGDMKP